MRWFVEFLFRPFENCQFANFFSHLVVGFVQALIPYLEHNEVEVLLKALEVVEKSLSMNQNFFNLDTHAALLYKLGRYEPALKQAKSAIDSAKKDGYDYSGTSELLYKIIDKM